jgi:hypothetical protein
LKYEQEIADHLLAEGVIAADEARNIGETLSRKKFSLHWELRVLLYIGITLFTSGLGVFIYNNIGSIGHIVLILFLLTGCLGCYGYAFTKAYPFSKNPVKHTNPFYDYVVLLGALLFISTQAYLQFRYEIYGNELRIPTLVASMVLFATAFRFDHKGVLTIAISLFAAFFGLVVTPMEWMQSTDFTVGSQTYTHTAILLGIFLYAFGWTCRNRTLKVHFVPVFFQFAANIMLVSWLMGTFGQDMPGLYYLGLIITGVLFVWEASKGRSFALFLSVVLAEYIGLTYWVVKGLFEGPGEIAIYLIFTYFTASGGGVIFALRNHKKILRYA